MEKTPRTVGIVTEYNPFHNGHRHMLEVLRGEGFERVVCAMSGPFVQRAEPALLPTAVRARATVAGGVDLVFRLPAPWALASAEGFARGGVGLLCALGCVDAIAFGAETPDAQLLMQLAALLDSEAFGQRLKQQLKTGVSFAHARAEAARQLLPEAEAVLAGPNNILAVEYCRALNRLEKSGERVPKILPIARKGAAHDGAAVGDGIASASMLRSMARRGEVAEIAQYVPDQCYSIYETAHCTGEATEAARWELTLLARLRGREEAYFQPYASRGEGLAERMASAAVSAVSLEELYSRVKSKRFAHSRVRRLAVAAALELPAELPARPPFAHLLAAGRRGVSLLSQVKQQAAVPVSTSLARLVRQNSACAAFARVEARCEDLHALCRRVPAPGGGAYTTPAWFEREKDY